MEDISKSANCRKLGLMFLLWCLVRWNNPTVSTQPCRFLLRVSRNVNSSTPGLITSDLLLSKSWKGDCTVLSPSHTSILFRAFPPNFADVILIPSLPTLRYAYLRVSTTNPQPYPHGAGKKCEIRQLWVLITKGPRYDSSQTDCSHWMQCNDSVLGFPKWDIRRWACKPINQPYFIPTTASKSKEITAWDQLHKNKWFLGVNAEDCSRRFSNFNYVERKGSSYWSPRGLGKSNLISKGLGGKCRGKSFRHTL